MSSRAIGVTLAFVTAAVSGVSIYVNGRAVKHFPDATVYTTAKNLVAGVLLVALALGWRAATRAEAPAARLGRRQGLGLLAVGVVGGSLPFVLFFEGLARAEATQAAFIQKTLVVWVALLAVPLLRERFGVPHALAICLLDRRPGLDRGPRRHDRVRRGRGDDPRGHDPLGDRGRHREAAAGVGAVADARRGADVDRHGRAPGLGRGLRAHGRLTGLDVEQWRWILLTGLLLTVYVATWYAALARAQAVDVTAVLVFGAVVTALLAGAADGAQVSAVGTLLVAAGAGLAAVPRASPAAGRGGRVTDAAGALLFARYAYPPNALGLCGADTPRTLLEYGDAHASDGGLAELARTFEGRGRTSS